MTMAESDGSQEQVPTLLVGIANPETMSSLMDLARCLAAHATYDVVTTHILVVPPQAHLGSARGSEEMASARQLLLGAIRTGAGEDVPVKGVVEVARDVDEGLISAAETQDASLIIVGYSEPEEGGGDERHFDRIMHEVARGTDSDLVIAKFRREEVRSILLPVNTGLNLPVSGMLAGAIAAEKGASVTLIHLLMPDEEERATRDRLRELLAEHDLQDLGELVVEPVPEDVDPIEHMLQLANEHDVTIVGAEPRPSIAESVFGSWAETIACRADSTVLLVRAKSVEEQAGQSSAPSSGS